MFVCEQEHLKYKVPRACQNNTHTQALRRHLLCFIESARGWVEEEEREEKRRRRVERELERLIAQARVYLPQMCSIKTLAMKARLITRTGTGPLGVKHGNKDGLET